ncbi:MAG: LOG family protein YvdD [Ignavibacteriaceae bacterium]|nr:LOG family protein YvdD [Ignavibacteriaceae bacterium]
MKELNKRIAVFCASSRKTQELYLTEAYNLGAEIARRGDVLVFGAGSTGLMGSLSDGALAAGGKVIGIIPSFMMELEWGRNDLYRLEITNSMEERKERMIDGSDAIVVLPGGNGTMDEFYQVLTMKRLGQYLNPIVVVNVNGFYDSWVEFMQHTVRENFMSEEHMTMFTVVNSPGEVYDAINNSPTWDTDSINRARL